MFVVFTLTFFTNIVSSQKCITVNTDNGQPVALVTVQITGSNGKMLASGVTDSLGRFNFNEVTESELYLTFFHISFEKTGPLKYVQSETCMQVSLKYANVLLEEIWFYSEKILPPGEIQFRKADFLQMAGSFDDPSRLLVKTESVIPVNDQNNAISFQGMPSHYNKWQINGGDVVNPNHLSNAGTSFDIYSPGAGGVNIISGQVTDQFSYKSPVAEGYEAGQVSGTASVTLADSIDDYAQLSLIGLEGGFHHKLGSVDLMANARYSFTGLLALMGVDFGGEVINYKDLVVGLSDRSRPLKWNTYFIYGDDSNTKGDAIWKSNTMIISNRMEWQIKKWNISHITNFSKKNTLLPAAVRWPDAKESLFFHKTRVQKKFFSLDFLVRDQVSESVFVLTENNKFGLIALVPAWNKKINNAWTLYVELPIMTNYRSGWKISLVQKAGLRFQNENINWSTGVSTQSIGSGGMILMDGQDDLKSLHLHTAFSLVKTPLRPSISLFYNRVDNPVFSFDEVWGDAQANLLPPQFDFMRATNGTTWGGNMVIKPRLSSNTGFMLNATLFRSMVQNKLFVENQTEKENINPTSNDVKYIVNGNIYHYVALKKGRLFVSLGWLMRGKSLRYVYEPGNTGMIVPENFSIESGRNYMRFDTRISYQRTKYTLSLDIQNFTNRVNDFSYGITQGWGDQLGLLPNISWKYFL